MAITVDGQLPQIQPGGIAPDAVGTVEIADESIAAIDIADIGKGFLFTGDGAGAINTIAVGTDTYILTADSAEGVGIKWAAPAPVDLSSRVAVAGDTMTGLLTLSGAPTVDLHAATKKYVDDQVSGIDLSPYVVRTGDTMTGTLTMGPGAGVYVGSFGSGSTEAFAKWSTGATDTALAAFVDGEFNERFEIRADGRLGFGPGSAGLDTFLSRTGAGILAMGAGDKLQQNAAPTVDDDLANKKYVDDEVGGIDLSPYVEKSGDTMTGILNNTANIIADSDGGGLGRTEIGSVSSPFGFKPGVKFTSGGVLWEQGSFDIRTNANFQVRQASLGITTASSGSFLFQGGTLALSSAQATTNMLRSTTVSRSNADFRLNADGKMSWDFDDDGTPDVTLDNSASGILTVTGKLQQNAAPTVDDDLANKKYVDDEVGAVDLSSRVAVAGDAMTGALTNTNDITARFGGDTVLIGDVGGDAGINLNGSTIYQPAAFQLRTNSDFRTDGTFIVGSGNNRTQIQASNIEQFDGVATNAVFTINQGTLDWDFDDDGTPDVVIDNTASGIIKLTSGKLQSPITPAVDDDVANKKYVDDEVGSIDLSPYLLKAGDTMSGALTMGSNNINSIGIGFFNTRAQAPQFRLESDGVLNAGFGSGDTAFAQSGETTDSFFRFEATRHGGLKWGDGTVAPGDVTIEHGSPNTLDIDGDLYIKGNNDLWMDAGSDFNAQALQLKMDNGRIFLEGGEIRAIGGSAASDALGIGISGDTSYRLLVEHDGDLQFGPGNAGPDVRLGWSAANIIAMSAGDKIQQNEAPTVDDDLTNKKYVDDGLGGLTAADIANVPAGAIAATDVQAAINELDSEKLDKVGGTMTGALLMNSGGTIIITGLTANTNVFEAKVQGNINESFAIDADGELTWDSDADGNPDVTMTAFGTRLDMGTGNQIRVDVDPASDNDLARKKYVDDEIVAAAPVFGTAYQTAASAGQSSTTSATPAQKLKLTTPSLVAGDYIVKWSFEHTQDNATGFIGFDLEVNDGTDYSETKTYTTGDNDTDHFERVCLERTITFPAGVSEVDLDYYRPSGAGTVYVEDAQIILWRVS